MNLLLRLEEAAMFVLALYAFHLLPYSWWWFAALILAPDIGMLGYLISPRIGAWSYNLFHHKGIAVLIGIVGILLQDHALMLAGVILFAHSSMDRMLGYGLKYRDSFKHTHLGMLR